MFYSPAKSGRVSSDPTSHDECENGDPHNRLRTDVPAYSQMVPHVLPHESPRFVWRSRRPPQSNYPPDIVPYPDDGHGLEFKQNKGGISLVTPPRLAPRLQRLPPMLHMLCSNPMPRYSKASRGLSVHMRVPGVFTGTTSSPSPWSRQ